MRKMLFLIFTFISTFTTAGYAANFLENDLLVELNSLEDSCIRTVKEGKYYLNSEKMHIQENKIFLNSETYGPLAVHCLMQDHEGIYTAIYGYWRCTGCGWTYQYQPSICDNEECQGTSFSWVDQIPGAD